MTETNQSGSGWLVGWLVGWEEVCWEEGFDR